MASHRPTCSACKDVNAAALDASSASFSERVRLPTLTYTGGLRLTGAYDFVVTELLVRVVRSRIEGTISTYPTPYFEEKASFLSGYMTSIP